MIDNRSIDQKDMREAILIEISIKRNKLIYNFPVIYGDTMTV